MRMLTSWLLLLCRFYFCDGSFNLAFQQPAILHTINPTGAWGPERAVDNNTLGSFGRELNDGLGTCCHTYSRATDPNVYWEVDLGNYSIITRIMIQYRETHAYRFNGYTIEVSDQSLSDGTICYKDTVAGNPPTYVVHDCIVMGRYVRYENNIGNAELCNVEVYGCPVNYYGDECTLSCPIASNCLTPPCNPDNGNCIDGCQPGYTGLRCDKVNLAFQRPAILYPKYLDGSWGAERAVDNNTLGSFGRDQNDGYGTCCHTEVETSDPNVYWEVDLGNYCVITKIVIQYREGYAFRFNGYTIEVSDQSLSKGTICYKDTVPGDPPTYVEHNCSVMGRYVRYENNKGHAELCNVEVYGRSPQPRDSNPCCPYISYSGQRCNQLSYARTGCPVNYYGGDCTLPCPSNCLTPPCNPDNGYCIGHCQPGYKGLQCDKECQTKKFGQNCEERCDNCRDTCDHVTGICNYGCDDGWLGTYCNISCSPGVYGFNCSRQCGNCYNTTCKHVDGQCDTCNSGYYGPKCDIPLVGKGPETEGPEVVIPVVITCLLAAVLAVIVAILIRRKRRKPDENESHYMETITQTKTHLNEERYFDIQYDNQQNTTSIYANQQSTTSVYANQQNTTSVYANIPD